MVEVFQTNVAEAEDADFLLAQIHARFPSYRANFDLDDCDHILRIECAAEVVNAAGILDLLKNYKFMAEVLEDELIVIRI